MATSGTYTITRTAAQLIKAAMRSIGQLESGQEPDAEEMEDAINTLNDLIKQYQGPEDPWTSGLKMWTMEAATLTLTAKNNFSLKPSGGDCDIQVPVEIITANLRDTDDVDTLMTPITLGEYQAFTNKAATGTPSKYYYEKRLTEGKLYLDVVPSDVTYTIYFIYRQPLEIISSQVNEFDIEDFWYRALRWNLAVELAPEYGVEPGPNLQKLAAESLQKAQHFQPETSATYFEPGKDD